MGTSCCKNLTGYQTQEEFNLNGDGAVGDDESGLGKAQVQADRGDRNVTFRRTVQQEEIGMYMREAYSEPELPGREGQMPKRKVSLTENQPQVIAPTSGGDELENKPLQRAKGRKGTGFAFRANLPPPEDDDDEDGPLPAQPADAAADGSLKRPKGRKGTGFVKKENVPAVEDEDEDEDEDEEEEEEEDAPAAPAAPPAKAEAGAGGLKRAKGRKGTGFVKKEALPPPEDDEE
mmetsp:Transcript_56237/g.131727  ORF Transcript_56237/g.131727 Transcript_56237/m.131727 type:complete len:233 (+) Transcript_56237:53-751(+)